MKNHPKRNPVWAKSPRLQRVAQLKSKRSTPIPEEPATVTILVQPQANVAERAKRKYTRKALPAGPKAIREADRLESAPPEPKAKRKYTRKPEPEPVDLKAQLAEQISQLSDNQAAALSAFLGTLLRLEGEWPK